jgi:two-component system sensor kinase FixL
MQHDAEITGYLFEHARDIILVVDGDGKITDANLAAEAAYGFTHDELLARTIHELRISQAAEPDPPLPIEDVEGLQFETVHRRADGSTFPVEISSRAQTIAGRRCRFIIIRDITDRQRFEADREQLLIASQHCLQLRDEFLMIASHELRAPITNVSLQLQQLTRQIERGAPRAQLRVMGNAAHREAGRLTALIDALLDAQHVKGQLQLELGEVDLSALVRDVTDRLRARAEQVGSEVVIEVPRIVGRWDRLRIDQVVTNLLLNALKYGRGRPVRVAAAEADARVHLEISDQGIGVDGEDLQRIFGKFERAVPAHYGGMGLGLFIARQIVEAHHGQVDVESVPGVGSTFRVMLPRS